MGSLLSQPELEPEPPHPIGLHGHRQRRSNGTPTRPPICEHERITRSCDYDFVVRVVGAFGCGKTSLFARIVVDRFSETPSPGGQPVDHTSIAFKGLNIAFEIWDSFQQDTNEGTIRIKL